MFYTKKSLGQNFLINQGVLDKIISTGELESSDTVLEIGPGTGNLTKLLSEKAGRVIAVEKDRRLIEEIREKYKATNVEVVEGDILKLDIEELFRNLKLEIRNSNYKVIGNIPYYITSNLFRTIFKKWPKPKLIVLTVQKEVAKRIIAKPPDMNLLALSVQFYSEPKIIGYISKGSFRPVPKVDSAIIKLTPRNNGHGAMNTADARCSLLTERFFKIARAGFSGKRKQLKNTLAKLLRSKEKTVEILYNLNINPEARPEELSLETWLKLARILSTT